MMTNFVCFLSAALVVADATAVSEALSSLHNAKNSAKTASSSSPHSFIAGTAGSTLGLQRGFVLSKRAAVEEEEEEHEVKDMSASLLQTNSLDRRAPVQPGAVGHMALGLQRSMSLSKVILPEEDEEDDSDGNAEQQQPSAVSLLQNGATDEHAKGHSSHGARGMPAGALGLQRSTKLGKVVLQEEDEEEGDTFVERPHSAVSLLQQSVSVHHAPAVAFDDVLDMEQGDEDLASFSVFGLQRSLVVNKRAVQVEED